jgi:hypothetical protein
MDDVREALRRSDIKRASRLAGIFTLTPVSINLRSPAKPE